MKRPPPYYRIFILVGIVFLRLTLIALLLGGTDKIPALQGKIITGGKLNIANALTGPTPTILSHSGENWWTWHIRGLSSIKN